MLDSKRTLILGGGGMLGHALQALLPNAVVIRSADYDLTQADQVAAMYAHYQPEYVFHLAAKVGGLGANMAEKADFYHQNTLMGLHVLHHAHLAGVKKVLSLLSTCIYPDDAPHPLREEDIHKGLPHDSNYAYAYAKRMLDVQSRACNFITAVPNNLFGEYDQFHLQDAHVIPAMIHKTYLAKKNNTPLHFWGDGSPLREFTYAPDLARCLVFLMEHYNGEHPINVGSSEERSIFDVAQLVVQSMGFEGSIEWDHSKPLGQLRKPSCHQKITELGWSASDHTPFAQALAQTCRWFESHYPDVRGVGA